MTCFDVRALNSSTLQTAFFHQGFNWYFFVEGKQFFSEIHGNCPLHRIFSTDWQKDAKYRMLLRGLGILDRLPKKTGSTSSIKVSNFGLKHQFLKTSHQNPHIPKKTSCYLYRFLSKILLPMLRNDTLDFIYQCPNLKFCPERVWFE